MSLIHDIKHGDDVTRISSVRFTLVSPKEILADSVAHIYKHMAKGDQAGTLSDPRLSASPKYRNAITYLPIKKDHGNMGHCELAMPVYHPIFFSKVFDLVKIICPACSNIRTNDTVTKDILVRKLSGIIEKERVRAANLIIKSKKQSCTYCGHELPDVVKDAQSQIIGMAFKYPSRENVPEPISASNVHRILERISDEDSQLLGYNPEFSRPEWMIITILPICPPTVRPSVVTDDGKIQDDDLTQSLHNIIKYNNIVKHQLTQPEDQRKDFERNYNTLQLQVAALIDNRTSAYPPVRNRSHRALQTIKSRHYSKKGRMRSNIQGKRCNKTARTVITADPKISIREKGIPYQVAKTVTFGERVNRYTRDHLATLVHRGADEYPGANEIKLPGQNVPINLSCLSREERENLSLPIGTIVYRHLLSGDIAMSNRQPTLHKMNMMAHRIKVLPGRSFRHSVNITEPYGADFDGDEMNLLLCQHRATSIELEHLAMSSTQMVSPQANKPVVGAVQDTVLSMCRASSEHICGYGPDETRYLNYCDFMKLSSNVSRDSGVFPQPSIHGWTTIDIINMMLPPISLKRNVNLNDQKLPIDIINGELQRAPKGTRQAPFQKDSGLLKASTGSLFHIIWKDHGHKIAADLLDDFSRFSAEWLVVECFSVGMRDFKLGQYYLDHIETIKEDYMHRAEQLEYALHNANYTDTVRFDLGLGNRGLTANNYEQFEQDIDFILKECRNKCQEYAQKHIMEYDPQPDGTPGRLYDNRFMAMVNSGSKGKPTNMVQIVAALGPQDMGGQRVRDFYHRRPLPLVPKDSLSAEDRGMVTSSYMQGNNLIEYILHAMAGRNGVISTSIKTAETGYLQRKLVKRLEDLTVYYDGTVRGGGEIIIQYIYGGDGYDGSKVEKQNINHMGFSMSELIQYYSFTEVDLDNLELYAKDTGLKINREYENQMVNAQVEQIVSDWKYLRTRYPFDLPDSVPSVVNFDRLLHNVKQRMGIRGQLPYLKEDEVLLPSMINNELNRLEKSLKLPTVDSINHFSLRQFFCLLRSKYNSRDLIFKHGYNAYSFKELVVETIRRFYDGLITPGEAVGPIAAQSIGEPTTQMTLDTFHETGGKAAVSGGVPRFKEILSVTIMKTPSVAIYLNNVAIPKSIMERITSHPLGNKLVPVNAPATMRTVDKFLLGLAETDQGRLEAKQLKKEFINLYMNSTVESGKSITGIMDGFENLKYRDVINRSDVYYVASEEDMNTPELSKFKVDDDGLTEDTLSFPCWLVIFEVSHEKHNNYIEQQFGTDDVTGMNYIYIPGQHNSYIRGHLTADEGADARDWSAILGTSDITIIDKIEAAKESLLNRKIRGINGIKKTTVRAVKTDIKLDNGRIVRRSSPDYGKMAEVMMSDQTYIIDTIGTNLLEILMDPAVDPYRTITNSIVEANEIFGIEAARSCIIRELEAVLHNADVSIDRRHISLLADAMTCRGFIQKIDRYGAKKGESGPISVASFEETTTVVCNAAAHATLDTLKGVSGNIMFGNFLKNIGTNAFDLLLDEAMLLKHAVDLPSLNNTSTSMTQEVHNQVSECTVEELENAFNFTL